ncbi:MAG TPA: 16S rRNA (uracil(1498)-N(3))-methyltransferase [Pseudonocardia sp.]|nr:16S rRNA (uracil(1498)-N(3))-methyltransferase [Pseudonocardia sp.]
MSTAALFLVEQLPAGGRLLLDGPEGRHAATVRRVRPGERVLLGDGCGGLAGGEVVAVRSGAVELTISDRRVVEPPSPRVTLAQALIKGDRGELAVELATEAGVDAIVPWRAARCVARWDDGPRGDRALARWRSTAREAAKQARRPWIPRVDGPASTSVLVRRVQAAAGALVLHESAGTALVDVAIPTQGELLVVVGPEGGIAESEIEALSAAGACPVQLGPEILRASTAAAVTLGALGVLTDRWAEREITH